ncbi:MAG: TolC family protein [Phycisphaerae bacterium]|nr:TolC family protein [Phycisphaerae bacterium]
MSKTTTCILLFTASLLCVCGCRRVKDPHNLRADYATAYPDQLAQTTDSILSEYTAPFTLTQCIDLALKNGLEARHAELQERLARLNKRISFSNFLPAVTLDYQQVGFDPLPSIKFNGTGIAMHDKQVREVSWNIQMSLFNPATWFLYHMNSLGYDMAKLSTQYTRQAMTFQVTSIYYQCLCMERMRVTLKTQLDTARQHEREMTEFHKEGMIPTWQAESAHVTVLMKQVEARRMTRALTETYGDLLVMMGLSPRARISLQGDMPLETPDGDLSDLLTEALIHHPSLAMAHAQVAFEKEKIKLAINSFLPQFMGFARRLDTTDSHQVYSNYWTAGLVGTLTVFNGFANVNQYKAAKVQQQDAFIQREQAALALMLQVMRAHDQIQTAQEQIEVVTSMEAATQLHWQQVKDQYDQGLVSASDLLDMSAKLDQARMQILQSQCQHQITIALLKHVLGQDTPEESHHESD